MRERDLRMPTHTQPKALYKTPGNALLNIFIACHGALCASKLKLQEAY